MTRDEREIVQALAARLHATPVYRRGTESELLESLEQGHLDLVVGGIRSDSPWTGRVALTQPFLTDTSSGAAYVLATAAGENGWLVEIERLIAERERQGLTIGPRAR